MQVEKKAASHFKPEGPRFLINSGWMLSGPGALPVADTGRDAGDASPHQTKKCVDMTFDFIENHHQKYFCTARYYTKN